MNSADADYGTNPFALTRLLRNECHICPMCRKECRFDIDFDRENEVLNCVSVCGTCGETRLVPTFGKDGDLSIYLEDSDNTYEPDQKCFELENELESKEISGSKKDDLGKFTELAVGYLDSNRSTASVDMLVRIVGEYRRHAGETGWEDIPEKCMGALSHAYHRISDMGQNERAFELLNDCKPLYDDRNSDDSLRYMCLYADSLANGERPECVKYIRDCIAGLESKKRDGILSETGGRALYELYHRLGCALQNNGDWEKALKAFKKSFDLACLDVKENPDGLNPQGLTKVADAYAALCFHTGKGKHGLDAMKTCIRICSKSKDTNPVAYALAVIGTVKFCFGTGTDCPTSLGDRLTETIGILEDYGDRDTALPHIVNAYFLRSALNADHEELNMDDAEKGYQVLREGLLSGSIPDYIVSETMNMYLIFLDHGNSPRAQEIRKEMAELGIWLLPPMDSFTKSP